MENRNEAIKETFLTVKAVADMIEEIVPSQLQEDWDNSGLLMGLEKNPVRKILTCLEINHAVLEEAKEIGADMIITHHPLIFQAISAICDAEYKNRLLIEIIRSGISVYSCHTPFDKIKGGNNDIIMERLGLISVKNLKGQEVVSASKMIERKEEADIGRLGIFRQPMTCRQVVELAAKNLAMSIRQFRICGELNREITKVGICTGAGADLMGMAMKSGCQMFITGDVKYHEAHTAAELGICLLDAGHYDTEKFFGEEIKKLLEKKLQGRAEIFVSKIDLNPFEVL